MKLMFLPVTIIEELPHVLLHYNFSRRKDRYYLSPYQVDMSKHGSQRTACEIIRESDFLCALFDIDRPTILQQLSMKTETNSQESDKHASLSSITFDISNPNDVLLKMIEQRLDFKHKCMFYSNGLTSDLSVCALDVTHHSSVLCNEIGFPKLQTKNSNSTSENATTDKTKQPTNKIRYQRRQLVYQWICIQDIVNGLITCNHILKNINEILFKIDLWIKQRNESKVDSINLNSVQSSSMLEIKDIKLFKEKARQLVWDLMEIKNEILFPRPCHGRIPNFRNCHLAAENLTSLDCFKRARIIKINPSLAQEPLRYLTLFYNKILLTPEPALETVFFYKLNPKYLRRNQLEWAATKPGAAELGTVMKLNDFKQMHIDLIIVASVVVNPITGARIGKGKGYGDLEYAILSQIGCVSNKTIVLTTCHESQLINDLPNNIMEKHDLPVDIIVTAKRFIYTKRLFSRPERVYWDKVDSEMLANIPVLQELKKLEEQE